MKIFAILSFCVGYISLATCLPQSVQIERQTLYQTESPKEQRGSAEETRRILQEIDKINSALGYARRRNELAYPRVVNGDSYYYPRQEFRPEFLTKPKSKYQTRNIKINRAINPFNAQNYFYPTPYLQVPTNEKPLKFETNPYFYPLVYSPLYFLPYHDNIKDNRSIDKDGSIKLGTIVVLPPEREPKAIEDNKKQTTVFEEIAKIVPSALRSDASNEVHNKAPSMKNDKFLDLTKKKHPQDNDEFLRKLSPSPPPVNRSFNFSSQIEKIQNLTKNFSFNRGEEGQKKSEEITSSTITPEDIEEETEEQADNKEDEKSPFGFVFGPKQQLQTFKEGGLIIQRLRVRHGGIAIAGPGGVATAGSGGTAIVGPNGIAFTHPRGLAIGGPGARIYAVPESTDLEQLALTHKARKLDQEGILVAKGPAIFYNKDFVTRYMRESRGIRDPRETQFANVNLITPQHHQKVHSTAKLIYDKNMPEKHQNMDIKYIQAIQQPNSRFNVEEFFMVPSDDLSQNFFEMPLNKIVRGATKKIQESLKRQKFELKKRISDEEEEGVIKVESEGKSSADQPFPDYSAYFPKMVYSQEGVGEESTLILEPNSRAISGNDGTSISTPLSRALLRKGVAVRVLFKPESVAISGAGGTSHAQADLILDFINE